MQDRYTADVGDYLKLGILRALSPGYRLGVAWWLYPDEKHNKDGRHIGYLSRPERWRHLDPTLFDALGQIVSSGQRDVRALEAANLLSGAIFASEIIPTSGPIAQRWQARHAWFQTVQRTLEAADLVFVDPDNGLEPAGFSHSAARAGKSITLSELRALTRPGDASAPALLDGLPEPTAKRPDTVVLSPAGARSPSKAAGAIQVRGNEKVRNQSNAALFRFLGGYRATYHAVNDGQCTQKRYFSTSGSWILTSQNAPCLSTNVTWGCRAAIRLSEQDAPPFQPGSSLKTV
jgi:hypothetical protein